VVQAGGLASGSVLADTRFIQVDPKETDILEEDDSVSCNHFRFEDRILTIWHPSESSSEVCDQMLETIEDFFSLQAEGHLCTKSGEILQNDYRVQHHEEFTIEIPKVETKALVRFQGSTKQCTITVSNAIVVIRNLVSEEWRLQNEDFYLLINGHHEGNLPNPLPELLEVRIELKGKGRMQDESNWEDQWTSEFGFSQTTSPLHSNRGHHLKSEIQLRSR
jgi:hypothetical protein